MRILITGSEGQVGSALEILCKEMELDYLAFNKSSLDITDTVSLFKIIKAGNPTILINAAAYTNVDQAEDEEVLASRVNTFGVKNLANICKELSIPLIHLSTDYVFDGKKSFPYVEEDSTNPINVYGKTKLNGEMEIKSILNRYIILRTSWVFSNNGKNFMNTILDLSQKTNNLSVVDDQFGSPTSASSIADAIIKICKDYQFKNSLQSGIYHFSGKDYVSWYEFAKEITRIAFSEGLIKERVLIKRIKTEEYPTKSIKPVNSCLSCSKIKKVYGIDPNNWQQDIYNSLISLK